ncbi:MAG: hypothetical protein ACK2U1_03205 [Anaerolineales bacterium]
MSKFLSFSQNLRPYILEGVKIIIWFFIIAAPVIFLVHSVLAVIYPYSLDYGEAPLIDQANRLAAGKTIYRADISTPPYTIANYPPLFVISLIPFLNWFDSPFHMARVVSVIATVFSAVFIGLTIRTFNLAYDENAIDKPEETSKRLKKAESSLPISRNNWFAALIAITCFIASPYVMQWSGLARIDSLALAFATGALFLLARWPAKRWAWLAGGLLLVAAAYTRQSYLLAAPLAAFVWLLRLNKRRAFELVLLVGGIGIGLFIILNIWTDGGFFYNIVTANVNDFSIDRLKDLLTRLKNDTYILLFFGIIFVAIGWRAKTRLKELNPWWLLAPFLVGAFLSGLTIGKIGSNINYFLELSAALALIAGILVIWSRSHPWFHTAVIFLITIQIGILLESSMESAVDWELTPRRMDFAQLQLLEQEVKKMDDPVLADEYMGMLTMNDRPLYIQPFEVSQLANAGRWDQQPFLDEIRSKEFDGILIHYFGPWPVHKERWTPEMLSYIADFYRPVKTLAGTVVHIPRGETGITSVPEPTKNQVSAAPQFDGQPIPISDSSYIAGPSIAINPTDTNILTAIATRASKQTCELPNCIIELSYFLSTDGGNSWQESAKFNYSKQVVDNGQLVFDPVGTLYIMGIRNNVIMVNRTSQQEGFIPSTTNFEDVTASQVSNTSPWLRAHPETGELFLTLDAQEGDMLFVTPSLMRSNDGIQWSLTTRADQHISASDIFTPRATGPDDIQVLFGKENNISMIWVWDEEPWSWPRTVWMANSTDGGQSFGEPTPILETWGPINSASADGLFSIAYRTGTEELQQLAVATTVDNGKTWHSTIASGDLSLNFEADKGPGISMRPKGTIDLVFYTHETASDECLMNVEGWQQTIAYGRIDPCQYNVYYTYSKDGGHSFSEPVKLNQDPIRGEDFIRFQGSSQVGSHLSVASSDKFAYPVWIETPTSGKSQVVGIKIQR